MFYPELPYELNVEIWMYLDYEVIRSLSIWSKHSHHPSACIAQSLSSDPQVWVTRAQREGLCNPKSFWDRSPLEALIPLNAKSLADQAHGRYVELVSRRGLNCDSSYFLTNTGVAVHAIRTNQLCLLPKSYSNPPFVVQQLMTKLETDHPQDPPAILLQLCILTGYFPYLCFERLGAQGFIDDDIVIYNSDLASTGYIIELIKYGHLAQARRYLEVNRHFLDDPEDVLGSNVILGALFWGDVEFLRELDLDINLYHQWEDLVEEISQSRNPLILTYVIEQLDSLGLFEDEHVMFINDVLQRTLSHGKTDNLISFQKQLNDLRVRYPFIPVDVFHDPAFLALETRISCSFNYLQWLVEHGLTLGQVRACLQPDYEEGRSVTHKAILILGKED